MGRTRVGEVAAIGFLTPLISQRYHIDIILKNLVQHPLANLDQ